MRFLPRAFMFARFPLRESFYTFYTHSRRMIFRFVESRAVSIFKRSLFPFVFVYNLILSYSPIILYLSFLFFLVVFE